MLMKKLLLSMAVLASVAVANAEIKTVVYDFKTETYGLNRETENSGPYIDNGTKLTETDGTVITLNKTEGKNGWRLWSDGLRIYKNSGTAMNITSTAGAITKVAFSFKSGVISQVNGSTVSGTEFEVKCDTKDLNLELNVANNGAIYTVTLTLDTDASGNGSGTEVEEPDAPEPIPASSVKDVLAQADNTPVVVEFPLTVAFVSYNNIFCVDAAGDFIQVYGKNSYQENDIIPADWNATYKLYNGATPELEVTGTLPAATEQGDFTPKAVAAKDLSADLVNNVLVVKNVTFAEATPATKDNFDGVSDGVTVTFRNNYTKESVAAGTYDVKGLVNVYQGAFSIYVLDYTKVDDSGVNEIASDNGEAVYFNLQGVKVANPEKGIFVRVQNGKATKVMM